MKRQTAGITFAVISLLAIGLVAQSTPNFAGKWTMVLDPNAPAGGGGRGMGGFGPEATIEQDASTLTITRMTPVGEFKSVYKLDGSESKNTLSFGGNSMDQVSIAKWDGSRLVVNTTMNFQGNDIKTSMILSLDSSGNLSVEGTRPDMQGGTVTTKSTYKKGS